MFALIDHVGETLARRFLLQQFPLVRDAQVLAAATRTGGRVVLRTAHVEQRRRETHCQVTRRHLRSKWHGMTFQVIVKFEHSLFGQGWFHICRDTNLSNENGRRAKKIQHYPHLIFCGMLSHVVEE